MSESKSKAQVPPVPIPLAALANAINPLAALADELGEIDRTLAPFRTRIARETALKSQMRAAVEAAEPPANVEVRIAGAKFDVILGPKALVRSINFHQLARKIGAKAFALFATCTLSQLDQHAPGMEQSVVTSANTGPRSLKIFERAS